MDVRFYLEPDLCQSARAGRHNFIAKMAAVVQAAGAQVEFVDTDRRGRDGFEGYSLTHMKSAPDAKGLTFRRVYHYPFWQIENSAARWQWDVTRAVFDPGEIDPKQANPFFRRWQRHLFQDHVQDVSRRGFIYVPLQGRLLQHRSFQRCSPIEMVRMCLEHDSNRPVVVGLHPKENYHADELAALEALEAKFPQVSVQMGNMEAALASCDYVVSMNSGAAFAAYFFGKPVMLFAKIDFHHIAISASPSTAAADFAKIVDHKPDVAGYLWWFWQQMCVNAGRPDVESKIARRLRRFDWPLPD